MDSDDSEEDGFNLDSSESGSYYDRQGSLAHFTNPMLVEDNENEKLQ